MLPSPLNIGLGLEYRVEEFETVAGEENSHGLLTIVLKMTTA